MNYIFIALLSFVFFGVGCQKTQPMEKNTPPIAVTTPSQNNIEPPVIGGTERDPLGPGEQCILNGDCELGKECIDSKCVSY